MLLILTSATAVVAQETADEFHQKTLVWMKDGNLAQIVWSVRYYREEAREAFYQALPEQIAKPTAENERWLNTIARAFRLEGMERPNRALRNAGYLWPLTRWRHTMFEGDGPMGEYDTHGTWDL
jgi:hypothetical protein